MEREFIVRIKENQDEYIDNDDVYVNHTGDYDTSSQGFIHNTCELLFVEEGEAEYTINGKHYVVSRNDILIIGATDMHFCRITKTPYIRYGVYFMPEYLSTLPMIRDYLGVYRTTDPKLFPLLKNLPQSVFDELCEMIHRIYREQISDSDDSMEMRNALMWQMTIILKRLLGMGGEKPRNGDSYSLMLNIRNYIDNHYSEDCSLELLSEKFFIQPATISRNFKRDFSTTFGNYLTLIRISNAVKLLSDKGESITEIAHSVGYNNVNTFIRAFTKIMEVSPLQYRKKRIEYMKKRQHYELQLNFENIDE